MDLPQFLDVCRANPDLDVYEFLEANDPPQGKYCGKLREAIYDEGARLGVALELSPEPFRASAIAWNNWSSSSTATMMVAICAGI
jgi:hypothetical protein